MPKQTNGSVRKVVKNDKTYWEGRIYVNLPDGRRVQKSVNGKTQKEVLSKLKQIQAEYEETGKYTEPSKMMCGDWFDTWLETYCVQLKPRSRKEYETIIKNNLKPYIGRYKLCDLTPLAIQRAYNSMKNMKTGEPISPKFTRCINAVLHKCLQKAVDLDMIKRNPCSKVELPRNRKRDMTVFDDEQIKMFIKAIRGSGYEDEFKIALFTGMRESEICGLTWDEIFFEKKVIRINHQIQKNPTTGEYQLVIPKNSKSREISVPDAVIDILLKRKNEQSEDALKYGKNWRNPMNLVFTHNDGTHICPHVLYLNFKKIAGMIGCPNMRFHDLRHSYATLSIKNGDPVKTVQENLGHATAAFTMEVYAHCTQQMKKESADRMQAFIESTATA